MTIQRWAGGIITGEAGDTKPNHASLLDWRFFEVDTGNIYHHNGTNWVLIVGATKTETLINKTIDSTTNTLSNVFVSPFALGYKRLGEIITATTPSNSLFGALAGWPTNGTASIVNDATEGHINNFNSSSDGAIIGYQSNSSLQLITRREWNAFLKVRVKASSTSNSRLYIGFSSNNTLPASDSPLGNTEHGCIIGFGTADANFRVFHNDAGGAAISADTGLQKDTEWHTFEMSMVAAGNITCMIDGGNSVVVSSRLPGNTTNIFGNIVLELAEAASKDIGIKAGIFRSDK
jgi:hypothetical protein